MTPILTDLQTNLQFKNVEMWDVSEHDNTLPTRDYFNKFAAIMLVGDHNSFINADECANLGTNCVSYLLDQSNTSSGGGIVLCSYSHMNDVENGFITGDFLKRNYFPLVPDTQAPVPNNTYAHRPLYIVMCNKNHFLSMGVGKT